MVEVVEIDTRHGWILVLYGFLGIGSPVVGGGNPESLGKGSSLKRHLVVEGAARCGQERIDRRFADHGIFGIALALNRPVVALVGFGHEIDTGVLPPEIFARGKLFPQPNVFKKMGIAGICFEPCTHEALKLRTLFFFGEGRGSKMRKYVVDRIHFIAIGVRKSPFGGVGLQIEMKCSCGVGGICIIARRGDRSSVV